MLALASPKTSLFSPCRRDYFRSRQNQLPWNASERYRLCPIYVDNRHAVDRTAVLSRAAGLTTSLAATTTQTSTPAIVRLISFHLDKLVNDTLASARRTFICPGMRPATVWMAKRTSLPFFSRVLPVHELRFAPGQRPSRIPERRRPSLRPRE